MLDECIRNTNRDDKLGGGSMKLKLASEVVLENTKTNRAAIPIEKAMRTALEKIAYSIQRQLYTDDSTLLSAEMLVYNDSVNTLTYDTIRASIQALYVLGAAYVNDAYRLNLIYTGSDADNVKNISKEILAKFYFNVVKWINREKQISQMEKAGMPVGSLGHLDIEAAIERLSIVSSTKAINVATVDKILQLRDKNETNQHLEQVVTKNAARGRPTINPAGVKQIEFKLFPKPIIGVYVLWVTAMDDKVCLEYCLPLEGTEFDSRDDNMPIPPDDVHPNCRCRLMIIDPSMEFQDVYGEDIRILEG